MAEESSRKYIKTKFEGVFYRLSVKKDSTTGDFDRIYCFFYTDAKGKGHWKTVGRHSEGVRANAVKQVRAKFLATVANTGRNPIADQKFTVDQAVEAYVAWCRANSKTFCGYHGYKKHLAPKIGYMPIAEITPNFAIGIKTELMQTRRASTKAVPKHKNPNPFKRETLAPSSIGYMFGLIAAAINRAIKNEMWAGKNPFAASTGVWSTRVLEDNARLRYLTKEEAKILLEDLEWRHPQLHDMVLLSLRTGLRPTEMFRLKREDVDASANVLNVLGKGKIRQPIRVPQTVIDMLLAYNRSPAEYIFQTPVTKKPYKTTPECFQTAIRALKLAPADGNPLYQITLHTMRHTFASWLAQSGKVSLLELQKLMRHKNIRMTSRYAHLMPGQETEKMSIIEDFLAQ